MYLLSKSHKTDKSDSLGSHLNRMMYLEPNKVICPDAGECMDLCLKKSGNMKFNTSRKARINRTKLYFQDRDLFLAKLDVEIKELKREAEKQNKRALVRLNGTSDIDWTSYSIFKNNPEIDFYDYTKNANLYKKFLLCRNDLEIQKAWNWPENYHLIYSFSEKTKLSDACSFLERNGQIAIVFNEIPKTWNPYGIGKSYEIINGDKHDLRILDKTGVVIGLKAKGPARKLVSSFVQ